MNYNKYHLNELATSYENSLQNIKELETQIDKGKYLAKKIGIHLATLVQGFVIERENLNNEFQK